MNKEISLQKMTLEEFKEFSQFSYENFLAETTRSSGKSIQELKDRYGEAPSTIRENDLWLIMKMKNQNIGFSMGGNET